MGAPSSQTTKPVRTWSSVMAERVNLTFSPGPARLISFKSVANEMTLPAFCKQAPKVNNYTIPTPKMLKKKTISHLAWHDRHFLTQINGTRLDLALNDELA